MSLPTNLLETTQADLEQLVADAIQENAHLEYKRDLPTKWDATNTQEFLADVTAMANATGGDIIYGMAEGDDAEAKELIPQDPHYEVKPGDVLMADRGLAHRRGIRHVVSHGGDVIVRMNLINVPVQDEAGQAIKLLPWLRKLKVGQAADLRAWIKDEQGLIPVRVCAIKKSAAQTRNAQDKIRQESNKDKRVAQPQTLEGAAYVVMLSTLLQPSAHTLLELYRCRWQVELAFKRLKSLLQLGHLKKTDPQGAKAWLQGKLLVASLIETLIAVGDHFSPWGYYLPSTR